MNEFNSPTAENNEFGTINNYFDPSYNEIIMQKKI